MSGGTVEIVSNLAAAWAAGGLIGLERSHNGRAAGFRTLSIVAIASAAAVVVTFEPRFFPGTMLGADRLDPTRIVQGVMTGIGFLGAGVIFKEGVSVQGLTTAAAIWATAAIGLLMGLGMIWPGALVTAAVLVTLILFRWIERVMPDSTYALVALRFHAGLAPSAETMTADLKRIDVTLSGVSYALKQGGDLFEVRGVLMSQDKDGLAKAAAHFRDTPHLVEFDISRISK